MAQVISVAAGKGGVGKTTTAVNLAAVMAETGRVLLVDADPQDAGSAAWWYGDGEGWTFDLVKDTDPELLSQLRLVDGYDRVVVDTPPRLGSTILRSVASASDLTVCVAAPEGAELVAAIQTMNEVPAGSACKVLLTQVDSRSLAEAIDAQNTLLAAGVPAFGAFIRLYKAHKRARAAHRSILAEIGDRSSEAGSDYRRATAEVEALLAAATKTGV